MHGFHVCMTITRLFEGCLQGYLYQHGTFWSQLRDLGCYYRIRSIRRVCPLKQLTMFALFTCLRPLSHHSSSNGPALSSHLKVCLSVATDVLCCALLCHVVPCCQVLLQPDGAGVRLPARLLALYSSLFDDLFQSMLEDEDQELEQQLPAAAGLGGRGVQQRPVHVVPVPGVGQDSIAAVCRWMMGLLALRSCTVATLVDMYRCVDYH